MSKQLQPKKIHYYKHTNVNRVADTSVSCKIVYKPLYLNTETRKHLRKYWQAETQKMVTKLKFEPNGGDLHVGLDTSISNAMASIQGGTESEHTYASCDVQTSMKYLVQMEKRRVIRELKGDVFVSAWKTSANLGVLLPMSVSIGNYRTQLYSNTIAELEFAYSHLQQNSVAYLVHNVVRHTFIRLLSVYTNVIPLIQIRAACHTT